MKNVGDCGRRAGIRGLVMTMSLECATGQQTASTAIQAANIYKGVQKVVFTAKDGLDCIATPHAGLL